MFVAAGDNLAQQLVARDPPRHGFQYRTRAEPEAGIIYLKVTINCEY